jgi:hypothetical protein
MHCGLEGSKGWREEEPRKYRTYSSIVECWFPAKMNCFIKCICMQRIKCICILIRKLRYAIPYLSSLSENKVTTLCKEQVRTCNNALQLPMLLSCGFWTGCTNAAYQQTTSLCWLITHKEQNLAQLPILLENTIAVLYIIFCMNHMTHRNILVSFFPGSTHFYNYRLGNYGHNPLLHRIYDLHTDFLTLAMWNDAYLQ